MNKPATHGLWGARTLFDEFQAAHVLQTEIAHFVVRSRCPYVLTE
jgi:hypothetical protein